MIVATAGAQRFEVRGVAKVQPLDGHPVLLYPGVVQGEAADQFVDVIFLDQPGRMRLIPGELARLEHTEIVMGR